MNDITFIMYRIGTGGKFVTEFSDAAVNRYFTRSQKSARGNVRWFEILNFRQYVLNTEFDGHYHGFFPEKENRAFYLSSIRSAMAKADLKINQLFVDTHYIEPETVDFFLEQNCRVIYINSTVEDNELIAKHFFYKNFLLNVDKFPIDHVGRLNVIKFIINDTENIKTLAAAGKDNKIDIMEHFDQQAMNTLINDNVPLHKWPDRFFYFLHQFSMLSTGGIKPVESQREDSDKLLNLEFSKLYDAGTPLKLTNFLGKPTNIYVQRRFNLYVAEQQHIMNSSIEQLIENFRKTEIEFFKANNA